MKLYVDENDFLVEKLRSEVHDLKKYLVETRKKGNVLANLLSRCLNCEFSAYLEAMPALRKWEETDK